MAVKSRSCSQRGFTARVALIAAMVLPALLVSVRPLQAQEIVDPRSGRLLLTTTDLSLSAGPIRLEIQRSLETRRKEQALPGLRWRLNWESRLAHYGELVLIEEMGATISFAQDAANRGYVSASGERLVVDKDGKAVRTKPDGNTETFDPQGRLIERDYRNGNKASLRYGADGGLSRVDGPRGSFIQLIADKTGNVVRIETSTGATVRYGYANEDLTEVQVSGGPILKYGYDATGALVRIDNPGAGAVQLAYDAKGRVLSRRWADGSQERYEYDDAAGTVHQIDAAGGKTTISWSQDKQRAEFGDPLGHRSVIDYDATGRILAATGPSGATLRNTYDALGRTIAVENPGGRSTRFEYLGDTSRVKTVVHPDGTRQVFEYDPRGNLVGVTLGTETVAALTYHPDGSVASAKGSGLPEQRFAYHSGGHLKSITNALGETTQFEYDTRGKLIRETNPLGGVTLQSYDPNDRLISLTDPTGRASRYEYDAVGRLSRLIDSAGGATRYEYDARGRLVAETAPAGRTTRYDYDVLGRLAQRFLPDGRLETYQYDMGGNLSEIVDAIGRTTRLDYDAQGRLIRERRSAGLEVTYRYDPLSNLVARHDSLGSVVTLEYDPNGRIVASMTPGVAPFRYARDSLDRVVAITDPLGQTKRFSYDAGGALGEVVESDGSVSRYVYDAAGRVAVVHPPGSGERRLAYDRMGNAVRLTNALGHEARSTYDPAGRLLEITDAKGQSVTFAYDPNGRRVEKRLPGGKVVSYLYDARSNVLRIDDGAFPVLFSYDAVGRVSRIEYPSIKRVLSYEYNTAGLRSKLIDSEGRAVRYEYDAVARLSAIRLQDGRAITLAYDAKDRVTEVRYPNGVTGLREYDSVSQVIRLTYTDPTGKAIAGWRYTYDAVGNRVETIDADGRSTRYRYDPNGQLVEQASSAGETLRYQYLRGGNRALQEAGGQTVLYRYDPADRLIEAGNEIFAYDANGNLVERKGPDGVTGYVYDAENRLVKVTRPDGAEVTFGYAPTGERIWRRDPTGLSYFVTDGVNLLAELDANLTPKATYLHALGIDTPLMMSRDGQSYYYHGDRLGSISRLTGDQGQVVAAYDYDAFGRASTSLGAVQNPFTFTARELDPTTGLYYYRARYYDPALGRFLSTDPIPGRLEDPRTLNPYLYARNNPLRFVDPLGTTFSTPAEDLYWVESLAEYYRGAAERMPAFREAFLETAERNAARAAQLRAENPGLEPQRPAHFGPEPGEPADIPAGAKNPTLRINLANPDAPSSGPPRVPTGRVQVGAQGEGGPPGEPAAPGRGTAAGAGGSVTRVGGAVGGIVGVTSLVLDYQACRAEGRSPEDCQKELKDKAPWIAAGLVVGGVLMLTPLAPVVAVGGAGLAVLGLNTAGNRLANAPEMQAQVAQQAQALEARLRALEAKHTQIVNAIKQAATSKEDARRSADGAASDLATLQGLASQIYNAVAACKKADTIAQQISSSAGDVESQGKMLDTGLQAASNMVASCTKKEDAQWVKDLYDTAKGLVAGMVIKARQAEAGNDALKTIQAAAQNADAALTQAQRLDTSVGEKAERASAGSDDAAAAAATVKDLAGQLTGEKASLHGDIERLTPWFAQGVILGWRGRADAAGSVPGEAEDVAQDKTQASAEARRAGGLKGQADALIAKLPSPVCDQIPTADDAVAQAQQTSTAALLAMDAASDLPSKADACLASLTAPAGGRSLTALSISCPQEATVGQVAICTATGVYVNDGLAVAVDVTSGPWENGPSVPTTAPGPVTVRVTRGGMTDTAIVVVKPPYNPTTDPLATRGFGAGPPDIRGGTAVGDPGINPTSGGPRSGQLGGAGAPPQSEAYTRPTDPPPGNVDTPPSTPGIPPPPGSVPCGVAGYPACPPGMQQGGGPPARTPSPPTGGKSGGSSGGASSGGSKGQPAPCPPGTAREPSEPEKGCH